MSRRFIGSFFSLRVELHTSMRLVQSVKNRVVYLPCSSCFEFVIELFLKEACRKATRVQS